MPHSGQFNRGSADMKPMTEAHFAILRRHMVEVIALQADLMSAEIGKASLGERILDAMRRVRRHLFVPPELAAVAYHDTPLPIGFDKTVSQPFICALMTVEWHRWSTPHQRRATSWFNNTKWKFGGVTIGADDDPVNTMNSPGKSRT